MRSPWTNTIRDLVADWDPHPTFFEIVTALALNISRDTRVEFVMLETGMGGRLDATNAIQPAVSVITPIDLDHRKWLGDTSLKSQLKKPDHQAKTFRLFLPVSYRKPKRSFVRVPRIATHRCNS